MKKIKNILISFLISLVVILIPWSTLKGSEFTDKIGYLNYVYYRINVLEYKDFSKTSSYFSNEWLWHYLLLNINKIMPYELFFNIISLLAITLIVYYLIRKNSLFSSLLLLNPLIIDLVMSQYRISLALIFVLISVYMKSYRLIRFTLIILAAMIHSSVLLLVCVHFVITLITNSPIKNYRFQILCLVFFGMLLSWMLSGYVYILLEAIGDRRAEYNIEDVKSSILYLSFWVINFFIVLYNSWKLGIKDYETKISIVILSLVTANLILGGYSTRFIALFLPVIMSNNLKLNNQTKVAVFIFYFIYCSAQWFYWVD